MISLKKIVTATITLCAALSAYAQHPEVNPELLTERWPAQWITCPGITQRAYGVFHFRKKINLPARPASFIVNITADNRYRFFVNGKPVCMGPARGDLYNWYFETVDLAPYLQQGENQLAALVWNMGDLAPVAQVSNQTGFLLQGNEDATQMVNTNESWRVLQDTAYQPCSLETGSLLKTYFVAGPGDHCKAKSYPWNWEQLSYNDTHWQQARKINTAATPVGYGTDNFWTLAPRPIPLMEEKQQRLVKLRRSSGLTVKDTGFLKGRTSLSIPAFSKVSLLLDQSVLTLAYPELSVSKGKGASIKLTYTEALYKKDSTGKRYNTEQKGNRNEIEGKEVVGLFDIFEPDGQQDRIFRPLWQRCYRYIQLDITTAEQPLHINDLRGLSTGYPFVRNASFTSSDPSLQDIWEVGWRTARLCAAETYYDCPYYEQLQYVADTRIQALISLYLTGDNRLMKKAIADFFHSRVPEGLTQGRYPSNRLQVIPPFSLYWISMLYDCLMHCNEDAFLEQYLAAAAGVLEWYEKRIDQQTGMLGPMKWWNFTDWSTDFINMGVPPGATEGGSSVLTLHLSYTLQQAAALFKHFNRNREAEQYNNLAAKLNKAVNAACFDPGRHLYANTAGKSSFSQHAGIMAILANAAPKEQQEELMNVILTDPSIAQATFYYRFYLAQAMKKIGWGDKYYEQLAPWRKMLENGLTTFAENPDPARSDCHAWSASPDYDFLATLCGITPLEPGFKKVQVKPEMGALSFVKGKMPSPWGDLEVSVTRKGRSGATAVVRLPQSVDGVFIWQQKQYQLKPGMNNINPE